jgi:phosphatidate phosphatase APP1
VLRRLASELADHLGLADPASPSRLSPDEHIHFFPSLARRLPAGGVHLRVHGWIYQPEHDSRKRALLLRALAATLGLDADNPESAAIFRDRARLFLVDNERAKRVAIHLGGRTIVMPRSGANGHFAVEFAIDPNTAAAATDPSNARALRFHAELPASPPSREPRRALGHATILPDEGLSVITDIDDTLRVSHVLSRTRLVRSTLAEPFIPVPGMRDLLAWLTPSPTDAVHYLSAAPWQLHAPLTDFLTHHHFPTGVLHLRSVRLKDLSLFQLFREPTEHKTLAIRRLLSIWPRRRVVLIGDSGERDPEIYAAVAREHPGRVDHVYIRDTTGESMTSPRYRRSLWAAMNDRWTLFTDPAAIPAR